MKKTFLTICAFLYLAISMGATFHLHYCMGKLVSWGLTDRETKNCSTCGMAKSGTGLTQRFDSKNCCRDEQKQIKAAPQDVIPGTSSGQVYPLPVTGPPNILHTSVRKTISVAVAYPAENGPPADNGQSLFILNRNFRL